MNVFRTVSEGLANSDGITAFGSPKDSAKAIPATAGQVNPKHANIRAIFKTVHKRICNIQHAGKVNTVRMG
ncbi:hypothetical protein PSJ8397_03254 [Pseudooctadecabacter jejudonensis]|uniref:Uncharacterized protein n=1 Tax=Pseudooctadecabacter jejudonensis TaxID=1391910 RepID=A0A1Y5TGM5_9RHOB|nr:hypothetical protein PSJ8397_03254 [Pseudooctadecabacter jejudonensis]